MATRYVWEKRTPPKILRDELSIWQSMWWTHGTSYSDKFIFYKVDNVKLEFTNNWSNYDVVFEGNTTSPYKTISSEGTFTLPVGYYRRANSSYSSSDSGMAFRVDQEVTIELSNKTYYPPPSSYSEDYYEYDMEILSGSIVGYSVANSDQLIGTVTTSSSSSFDTTQPVGGYRYIYKGSDNIDATAIGYSTQSPMGGKSITINVTPRSNTYGGTIQYTYQVQLSGGSWTTIATKTTATSQQYTIPAGTTSFAARVVANDTWGFSSSSYTTGSTITVTNNKPPTAPGSISIGGVVGGQQCTITWTAATDPDGTIASYQLERQVDNGNTWTQIYSGSALTYTDTIDADWATVNYRVKATDNDGDSGPYVTGTMQTVNDGWLYFSGPPSDMGEQPTPFDFVFSVGSTGVSPATNISVAVIYDDETIYTGTVASAQQITLNIDTRLAYAGDHDIIVTASADSFLAVTQGCTFTVPEVALPDGGGAGFMEDDAGNTYYPATLARYVIGLKSLDANALFDRVYTGTYTGTGTSGSGNQNNVILSFEPILVFIQAAAASTATSGYWVNSAPGQSSQGNMIVNNNGTVSLCPVTWDAEAMTLSWYGSSAAAQLNTSGTVYGIIVLGGIA